MSDNLNRKSNDESNKMLRDPSQIYKKTILTLKKKYGYTEKQIISEFKIADDVEPWMVDLAIFSNDTDQLKNLKIIGEIKIGNFVFPFAEYQLEKYMKRSNTQYGFLTNGKEWINYELLDKKIIRISDIPTSKELKSLSEGKRIEKKFEQLTNADYILHKIVDSIHSSGYSSYEPLLQLILFKLYDENYENNQNFKKITKFPETNLEVFETLWGKTNINFLICFHQIMYKK